MKAIVLTREEQNLLQAGVDKYTSSIFDNRKYESLQNENIIFELRYQFVGEMETGVILYKMLILKGCKIKS